MRNMAALFFLALSLVGVWLISRDHGFSLSHLLESPGDKHAGVITWAAPVAILLLTLWALGRLAARGDSPSGSSSTPSSQCPTAPSDASESVSDKETPDDSQDDDA
jgi:hypothetical protein